MRKQQTQSPQSPGKRTAKQIQRLHREKVTCVILKCILLLTAALFIWITNIGCAWGWIKNAKAGENWPADFVAYGQMLLVSSALFTVAIVLVFLRRNLLAAGSATVAMALCLIAVFRVTAYAADSGFYSQVMDMSVDTLYRAEILPTLLPYACILALAAVQFFSVSAQEKRREKKRREEQEAPPII